LALAVLSLLLLAMLAPLVHRWVGDRTGMLLALLPAGIFAYFLSLLPALADGGVVLTESPWLPGLGVTLAFRLDGLSLLFALLVTGLGALITLYAGTYLKGDPLRGRFLLYLLLFMAAMLGMVLADNLILLFVFWELTSFSSYLLIGYKHQYEESRKSALQALLVTGLGGLALLAGLILLGIAAGDTFSLSTILASGDVIRAHPLYLPAFALVAAGCFTKSAQVPFHFWLPNAMAAPTPVSAYLHSATMVKAGVYLLARMHPALGGTDVWTVTLTAFGTATMLTGAILALRHTDLKKVLAYSTVTALGTLVMLLGLSVEGAIKAAVVFLLVHAMYKGALFLVAGSVDHESGTRNVLELGGLRKAMPITFGAAIIAALSMAGLPPLFGFIGKELAYEAALHVEGFWYLLPVAAVLANALTVVAAGIVAVRPFFGAPTEAANRAHEAPWMMWLGPAVLASGGVLMGLLPMVFSFPLLEPTVRAVLGEPMDFSLYLWHGINLPLIMSVVTVALGVAVYLAWDRVRGGLARLDPVFARGPERGYELTLKGMLSFAAWQTRVIQNGNLRHYILATLVVAFGSVGVTFVALGVPWGGAWEAVSAQALLIATLVLVGALLAASTRSRLLAAAALGVSGFGVALMFILLGAPDLAMTQFLVETLIVIVLLLVMQRLPSALSPRTSALVRTRDAVLGAAAGGVVTVLLLAVLRQPFDPALADFFVAESVPGGFGRNIVNVILVDFRALDTLGEIAVLGIAALGAFALLWRAPEPGRTAAPPPPGDGARAVPEPDGLGTAEAAAHLSRQ
jgi:multicomponent Na+:H+ antiporter subunit A